MRRRKQLHVHEMYRPERKGCNRVDNGARYVFRLELFVFSMQRNTRDNGGTVIRD